MNETINQRLGIVVNTYSKSISDFARKISRPSQTITSALTNRSKPGAELLDVILRTFPQIDALWLICGIGEMQKELIDSNQKDTVSEMLELLKRENQILLKNNEAHLEDKKRMWNLLETIGKKDEANEKSTPIVKLFNPQQVA